jgi:hypothetical protein
MVTLILLVAFIYSLAKSWQLHAFSNIIAKEVHELYRSDRWTTQDINVEESYSNLLSAFPWNTNFKEMIVYEVR